MLNLQDISVIVFGDLSCYDCINNPQDPTEKLQIKMGINFPLDAPQSRHDIAEKLLSWRKVTITHSLLGLESWRHN